MTWGRQGAMCSECGGQIPWHRCNRFDKEVATCSDACARARKTRLQRDRRVKARLEAETRKRSSAVKSARKRGI